MTFLELLRKKAFWFIDSLRGGDIRKHYDLLESIEGCKSYSELELADYYKARITKLLAHCVRTVPAYSAMTHTINQHFPLDEWPVVNKMTLKEGGERYLSTDFDRNNLIAMTTSGSTGTPFTCWQNQNKKRHVNAEVLFYNGQIGYEIGRKIIYFRSVVKEVAKSRLQQFMQNIDLIDCTDLSDEGIRKKIAQIKKVSRNGGAMILSYASTLDAFCKYFEKYGTAEAEGCNIYGIVSGSEMLKDSTRETLGHAFGCKVVSRYANEENGFLGQDGTENNVFMHNRANYYIEILKFESDTPTETGEVGRVVITDLYNYSMPMVRYDTGDVGAWQEICINGIARRAIGQFGGRRVDMVYDSNGNIISPHSITNYMWHYNNVVKQFQFVQIGRGEYCIRINPVREFDTGDLINGLNKIVGENAKITLELCDEIPVLASGKRRYIVNLMNSNSK